MTRSRLIAFLAGTALVSLTALSVAACGGGSNGATASTTPPTQAKNASAQTAAVHVAKSRLGKILVDSQGRTLYLFKKDSRTKSACTGACAKAWPPLRASGKPTAGSGATASRLGTIRRSDGEPQVTYSGHPLYRFVKDKKRGDTKGEGVTAFGASWFVLSPAGKQVSPAAPKASPPPAPKASPPPRSNGIPQNGGGDGDSDNFGGPSDGDGDV